MARFAVIMKQRGEGCDYTIGCGMAVHELQATTRDGARAEAEAYLTEDGGESLLDPESDVGDRRPMLRSAVLVEMSEDLPIDRWFANVVAQENEDFSGRGSEH